MQLRLGGKFDKPLGKVNKMNMDLVNKETMKNLKRLSPNHSLFKLSKKEQFEFLQLLRDGQGSYIKQSIIDHKKEIAIPGVGTFLANPLRDLVQATKKEFKGLLTLSEMNDLIKQRLSTFFKHNRDPFKQKRATPINVKLKL